MRDKGENEGWHEGKGRERKQGRDDESRTERIGGGK